MTYWAGQGRAGQGRAGKGREGQGRAGQGRAGQGRAEQSRMGQINQLGSISCFLSHGQIGSDLGSGACLLSLTLGMVFSFAKDAKWP